MLYASCIFVHTSAWFSFIDIMNWCIVLGVSRLYESFELFQGCLVFLGRFLETNELAADPCFVYLFSVLNDLENGKISDILKHLQHAVKSIAPCGISLQNSCIRRVTAIMHEPTGSSDNPIRFTTGLTVTVPVHATFENVQNVDCIRLKVHVFCCPFI